jgi:hypothetical protein
MNTAVDEMCHKRHKQIQKFSGNKHNNENEVFRYIRATQDLNYCMNKGMWEPGHKNELKPTVFSAKRFGPHVNLKYDSCFHKYSHLFF